MSQSDLPAGVLTSGMPTSPRDILKPGHTLKGVIFLPDAAKQFRAKFQRPIPGKSEQHTTQTLLHYSQNQYDTFIHSSRKWRTTPTKHTFEKVLHTLYREDYAINMAEKHDLHSMADLFNLHIFPSHPSAAAFPVAIHAHETLDHIMVIERLRLSPHYYWLLAGLGDHVLTSPSLNDPLISEDHEILKSLMNDLALLRYQRGEDKQFLVHNKTFDSVVKRGRLDLIDEPLYLDFAKAALEYGKTTSQAIGDNFTIPKPRCFPPDRTKRTKSSNLPPSSAAPSHQSGVTDPLHSGPTSHTAVNSVNISEGNPLPSCKDATTPPTLPLSPPSLPTLPQEPAVLGPLK